MSANNLAFYQPDKHENMIKSWYQQWNMDLSDTSILPTTGIVIENICAAFLYETNSSMCMIESLITNREVDKKTRDECLNQVVEQLIKYAKDKGFKYMMGFTKHEAVVKRAKLHNFNKMGDYVGICNKLTEK